MYKGGAVMPKNLKKAIILSVFSLMMVTVASSGYADDVVVDQWEIPFITIKTGAIAHIGLEVVWAVEKAAKEINEAGGIAGKPIVLKTYDTGYDPARAVSCMKQAIQGSQVIVGPLSTMDVRSCAAIAARDAVMCLPVASSIGEVSKVYPWAVVFISDIKLLMKSSLDWFAMFPDIQNVVIFRDTKNPVWIEESKHFETFSKEAGKKVLDVIDVAADAVDVSSPVIRGLGRKPDAFLFGTESAQTARLIVELSERGWKKMDHMACHTAVSNQAFFEVGGEHVNGVYILGITIDYDYSNPKWQSFIKDFGESHSGAKPAMYIMPYYDVLFTIKAAIENTGVTGDPAKLKEERIKIRDYIRNLKNFPGVYKPFTMDPGGWAHTDVLIAQVQDGVAKIVPQK
jgi:branched-chain amino acid transport system substrate-binding protein